MSYVETFMKEKPKIGLEIMGARVKKSKQLDEELSDFFRERAQIEELYSKQLLKLAKKSYITEKGMFNHLDSILSKLQKEVEEISINHQTLSQNITKKVDKIVRESTNIHLDSSSIRLIEGNSQRLTKEYEEKSAKIAKLQKSIKSKSRKNETTNEKIVELSRALEEIRVTLDSEIKRFYEQHERVDQSRLETLKKALSNYENFQIESLQNNLNMAQNSLQSITSLDTKEQLLDFATGYRDLNLVNNNSNNSLKLTSKIDSGFGSWILRPRKNSNLNIANTINNTFEPPSKDSPSETISLSGSEVYSQKSNQVDEEGYTIPPHEKVKKDSISIEKESLNINSDSENEENNTLQKVKFDIRDEVIQEDPNDVAKAMSNMSNSLKMSPVVTKRQGRTRRERKNLEGSKLFEQENIRPMSEINMSDNHSFGFNRSPQPLRPISEFTSFNNNQPEKELIKLYSNEIIDGIITCNEENQLQISGEIQILINHQIQLEDLINYKLQLNFNEEQKIQLYHNNKVIQKLNNENYEFIKDSLDLIKEKQITLFKYKLQSTANSSHLNLPFFIKSIFHKQTLDNSQYQHKLAFIATCKPIIQQVNFVKLSTQLLSSYDIKSIPNPEWNSSTRELTWETNNPQLHIATLFESSNPQPPLFAFNFNVNCTTALAPIQLTFNNNNNNNSIIANVKAGTLLICSKQMKDIDNLFYDDHSVYSTAKEAVFSKQESIGKEKEDKELETIGEDKEEMEIEMEKEGIIGNIKGVEKEIEDVKEKQGIIDDRKEKIEIMNGTNEVEEVNEDVEEQQIINEVKKEAEAEVEVEVEAEVEEVNEDVKEQEAINEIKEEEQVSNEIKEEQVSNEFKEDASEEKLNDIKLDDISENTIKISEKKEEILNSPISLKEMLSDQESVMTIKASEMNK